MIDVPPFPRRCQCLGMGEVLCHGFFGGTKYVDYKNQNVPEPVAVVEHKDGRIEVLPAAYISFAP